jgi:hypothetical protein
MVYLTNRPRVGPTYISNAGPKMILGQDAPSGSKAAEAKADHSSPCSADVKSEGSYTSSFLICFHGMALRNTDNFTVTPANNNSIQLIIIITIKISLIIKR